MRKLAVITGAAMALAGTWTAVAGQYNDISTQPQANAYVSMEFGHARKADAAAAPFHYGLRMSYDDRLRSASGAPLPALAQWDFDSHGNRIAMVGGIPFMAHLRPPLRQNDDQQSGQTNGQAPQGIGPEGLDFFDLTLLVVGVAAIGYLIYEVADNKESPDPAPAPTTGGLLGGLLGGATGGLLGGATGGLLGGATGGLLGGATGGLLGGATGGTTGTTGGLLGGLTGGLTGLLGGYSNAGGLSAERDVERLQWLNGGNGQMGDLQPN